MKHTTTNNKAFGIPTESLNPQLALFGCSENNAGHTVGELVALVLGMVAEETKNNSFGLEIIQPFFQKWLNEIVEKKSNGEKRHFYIILTNKFKEIWGPFIDHLKVNTSANIYYGHNVLNKCS